MPEQPLPPYWTEEVDANGRRFYSNHITQTTQWERPAPNEPQILPEYPPIRQGTAPEPQQVAQSPISRETTNWEWTPRTIFWVAAVMAIPVWIFALSATVDDSWLDGVSLSVVDENILSQCADEDLPTEFYGFCEIYVAFMMMQLIAVVFASVALGILLFASFLSAEELSCCSSKIYGLYGGAAVAAFAAFQVSALILMISIDTKKSGKAYFFDDADADNELGATFWIATVGFIFGVVDSSILLNVWSFAGEGLLYERIAKLVIPKN